MHTVILGARGQLGRDLVRSYGVTGTVTGLDQEDLDIADADAIQRALCDAKPNLVINAAAYTDVEAAEDDRARAFETNETGAGVIAEAAQALNVPLVYYSTDFVFDGRKEVPYEPDDPIAPKGVYAESKAAGEQATRERCDAHYVIRTAWVYGPGGNNFVEKILRAAETRPSLNVVSDEVGSPTYTADLVRATQAVCATGAYGTYHAVNTGVCSRYEFAQSIVSYAGLDTAIEPCGAADFPSTAPRPADSVVSNAKLERVSGFTMPPWQEALQDYMNRRREVT